MKHSIVTFIMVFTLAFWAIVHKYAIVLVSVQVLVLTWYWYSESMIFKNTRISFLFAWYDMWIGVFWDRKAHWLYILPVPMCGIVLKFSPRNYKIHYIEGLYYVWYPAANTQLGDPTSERDAYLNAWNKRWRVLRLAQDVIKTGKLGKRTRPL